MPKLIRFIAQFDNDQEVVVEPGQLDEVEVAFEKGAIVKAGPLKELPRVVGQFMRLNVKAIVLHATTRLVLKEDNLPALREVVAAAELWRFHWSKVRPMQPEDAGFREAVTLMFAAEQKLAVAVEKFSGLPVVENHEEGAKLDG